MGIVRIRIADEHYEIDQASVTLGEKWLLQRDYATGGDENSVGALVGLLVIAMVRKTPELSYTAARELVEGLTDEQVEIKVEDDTDPTVAGPKPRKPRKSSGTRQ